MGTSAFAVPTLVKLFEAGNSISCVITQPDKPSGRGQTIHEPPVKIKARDLKLSVHQPSTLKDDNARALFKELEADMIVVVAYGKILPAWLLELPRFGAINVHGSLLPKYRGAAPVHWAIANGETETGVCTMKVDIGLDTGPVYLCETTAIGPDETVSQLSERLSAIGGELALKTVAGVAAGHLTPHPQDNAAATLAPILKKHHGFIDWFQPALAIHNRVRAFNPWPGTVTRFRGGVCKILKTRVDGNAMVAGDPGSIAIDRSGLHVRCGGESSLEILMLQPENRKPISGRDFANGSRVRPDEKFHPLTDNE